MLVSGRVSAGYKGKYGEFRISWSVRPRWQVKGRDAILAQALTGNVDMIYLDLPFVCKISAFW